MKTSSKVGLLTEIGSISPGKSSTTSVMKRWPLSRSSGCFVQQENGGVMKQSLRQFQPPLHPSGESFCFFVGAICQPNPAQHFCDARFQWRTVQAVEMSLVPE